MATTVNRRRRLHLSPAAPSWQRLALLVSLLLLGWAALPTDRPPLWWHYAIGVVLIVAFLGSWHGQHLSTAVRRWAPMSLYNRRQRAQRVKPAAARKRSPDQQPASAAAARTSALEAQVVIHLRPHPHAFTTPGDESDQLPWDFITAWFDRYGVRADMMTIAAITRTPPPSGLRTDAAAMLSGRTPQHRDTWITYTLRAENNVGVLTSRRTTVGSMVDGDGEDDETAAPKNAALADTMARRLVAELRERGWLATLPDVESLPVFTSPDSGVRQEHWTGTECIDGFRAVYAVEPDRLSDVLGALPALPTKASWVVVTVRAPGLQPPVIEACVGTLTSAKPARDPLPGLKGFHGLHRRVMAAVAVTGFEHPDFDLPVSRVALDELAQLRWPTSAVGVPIGFNRHREPVYLGLASPEPVRITVTGTGQFHVGIVSRIALSGMPIDIHTSDPRPWAVLANHGAPQQILVRPSTPRPGAIVVTDGSVETPNTAFTVTLRRPQSAHAPSTTIVITQDGGRPNLFQVATAHGQQWLSTRLVDGPDPLAQQRGNGSVGRPLV